MARSSDILVRFGRRLREKRTELGLSQEAFADKCGLDRTYISGIERGKRNLSLLNIETIAKALGTSVSELTAGLYTSPDDVPSLLFSDRTGAGLMATRSIPDYFDVTLDFFTKVILDNPSLRGMVLGYIAEAKLREVLSGHGKAIDFRKDDDHDRKKKGDLVVTYKGFEFKLEVKSLQTNTVELLNPDTSAWVRKILKQSGRGMPNPEYLPIWEQHRMTAQFKGQFQCDASDRREVKFPDDSVLETTNLLFGEFHILAAGLFPFREKWDFAFALNRDLPKTTNPDYTPYQSERLITSLIGITWPVQHPFTFDLYELLDKLVAEEQAKVVEGTHPVKEATVVEEKKVKLVKKKGKKKS